MNGDLRKRSLLGRLQERRERYAYIVFHNNARFHANSYVECNYRRKWIFSRKEVFDMRNTKICPKCNGNQIVLVEGNAGAYGSGNNIMVGATIFSAIMVD